MNYRNPPPHDLDLENSIISLGLRDPEQIKKSRGIITADDFYNPTNKIVFGVFERAWASERVADITYVITTLKAQGKNPKAAKIISDILDNPRPSSSVWAFKKLRKFSLRRELIKEALQIEQKAKNLRIPFQELLTDAKSGVCGIKLSDNKSISFGDVQSNRVPDYEKLKGKIDLQGVLSGYNNIDRFVSGFAQGDLIILGARPSMGKTALIVNMIVKQCKAGMSVGFLSLEMPKQKIQNRINSLGARIDSMKFRRGGIEQEEYDRLTGFMGETYDWSLFIDDQVGINELDIRAKAQYLVQEQGVQVLYIDYLQLIHAAKKEQRKDLEIGTISRTLKEIAKEFQIPVVVLSQLNRALEQRTNPYKRPCMADLRESGAIEQDADLIMFLYRPVLYGDTSNFEFHGSSASFTIEEMKKAETDPAIVAAFEREVELIFAKNRDGDIGTLKLHFQKEFTEFREFSMVTNNV